MDINLALAAVAATSLEWEDEDAPRDTRESARQAGGVRPADLGALREESRRWIEREKGRPRLEAGAVEIERVLGGGWPLGKIAELIGPASAGRTGTALATVVAATGRGEVAAWIDGADAFDPPAAATAGVALDRLLWVRPRNVEQAVRAAELIAETGGFTVLVVDLDGVTAQAANGRSRERAGALHLRLARATERARLVTLVLAERRWAGALAGVTLRFERGRAVWGGDVGAPRWLVGLTPDVRLDRDGDTFPMDRGGDGDRIGRIACIGCSTVDGGGATVPARAQRTSRVLAERA